MENKREQNRLIIQCIYMLHIVVHQYKALCYISDGASKNISHTGSNQIIQSVVSKGDCWAGRSGPYLFVWMGAVVAEHQVGPPAVKQQVSRLEGQGEALDALAEVKGVPQVVVGGVHEEILRNMKEPN